LPQIIKKAGIYFDYETREWVWNPEMDMNDRVLFWVILCYNYARNYGPRPEVPGVSVNRRLIYRPISRFICPFCGRVAENVLMNDLDSLRYRSFIIWLVKHGIEYHNWFTLAKFVLGFQSEVKKLRLKEYTSNKLPKLKIKPKRRKQRL
jgi:hypothetical protein